MISKINFNEKINSAMYADYRVFIFGVEVTNFLVEDLSWLYADRDGENTARFTLQNAFDNFILTEANLGLVETVNEQGQIVYTQKNKPAWRLPLNVDMYSEAPKKQLVLSKQTYNPKNSTKPAYPLGLRNMVIHKNDPVRIFVQNPLKLGEWYNVFTGYVNEASKTGSYITGQSTISVDCTDIRTLMQHMRVSKSPTWAKANFQEILVNPNSFFGDMINPTENNHPFAKTSYEKSMEALIIGQYDNGKPVTNSRGIGSFAKGDVYYFDPLYTADNKLKSTTTSQVQTINSDNNTNKFGTKGALTNYTTQEMLDRWYKLCLYGANMKPLTNAQVTTIGKGTVPGGDYAPDHQKFYMLLPKVQAGAKNGTALGASSLTEYHLSEGVEQRDFVSRCEIIRGFSDTIDYQFWVTGNGDIVFEFPMYELQPKDFGPDVESLLTVDDMLISDSVTDEEGDILTGLVVTGANVSENKNIAGQDPSIADTFPRVVIVNPGLIARFGPNIKSHTIPTVINRNSLQILGYIEYNKRLSAANKLSFSFGWRPWLLPNKPVYHKEEQRIGNTTSVSNRMQFYKECSTDVTMRYIRKRNEQGLFCFLDGSQSIITSYVKAWASQAGLTAFTGPVFINSGNAGASTSSIVK